MGLNVAPRSPKPNRQTKEVELSWEAVRSSITTELASLPGTLLGAAVTGGTIVGWAIITLVLLRKIFKHRALRRTLIGEISDLHSGTDSRVEAGVAMRTRQYQQVLDAAGQWQVVLSGLAAALERTEELKERERRVD